MGGFVSELLVVFFVLLDWVLVFGVVVVVVVAAAARKGIESWAALLRERAVGVLINGNGGRACAAGAGIHGSATDR